MWNWIKKKFSKKETPTTHSGMSVEKFVEESLVQICNGIRNAQKKITRTPFGTEDDKFFTPYIMPSPNYKENETREIHFDIATTVEQTSSSSQANGASLKHQIYVVEASVSEQETNNSTKSGSSVTRIQFSIPVIYPQMPLPQPGSEK